MLNPRAAYTVELPASLRLAIDGSLPEALPGRVHEPERERDARTSRDSDRGRGTRRARERPQRPFPHRKSSHTHRAAVRQPVRQLEIRQSMGRGGSCFDSAAAEAFVSSVEWEVLRDAEFRGLEHAQAVTQQWC